MKPLKSLTVITWLLVISSTAGYAQNTYRFGYNASGDRTGREVTGQKSAESTAVISVAADKQEQPDTLTGILNGREVKAYPNPLHGILTVEISLNELTRQLILKIRDPQDSLVTDQPVAREITRIDLGNRTSGNYTLEISSGDEICVWQIIKE